MHILGIHGLGAWALASASMCAALEKRKLTALDGLPPLSSLKAPTIPRLHGSRSQDRDPTDEETSYDLTHLPFETVVADELPRASPAAQGLWAQAKAAFPFFQFHFGRKEAATSSSIDPLDNITRKKPFLWVHIHKAGGTFMCTLAQLAGERIIEPSDTACNWKGYDQFRNSGSQRRISCAERVQYFKADNHNATWGQIEREFVESDRCWHQFDYGVTLREPISLLTSQMNYHPGCWLFGGPCGGGPQRPKEFLRQLRQTMLATPEVVGSDQFPLWKFFDNFQTRILAPALDVPPGKINASHVAAARKALKNFKVVARLEDMPKYGPQLFAKLGWKPAMMNFVGEPVNPSEHEFHFSHEDKVWLRALNRFDYKLYNAYGEVA